jgi:drug/metabolite transporter, DME family
MSSRATGMVLVFVAALLWSTSGVLVKSLTGLSAAAITGWRSLFTLPLLAVALVWLSGSRRGAWQVVRTAWTRPTIWGSALCYAGTLILFIRATKLTTAANAIFLQYTAPVYVALLSWPLLREPIGRVDLGAMAGCLTGMACFFAEDLSLEGREGNVLALLSGLAWAGNTIFLRLLAQRAEREAAASDSENAMTARERPNIDPRSPPQGFNQRARESVAGVLLGNILTFLFCVPWLGELGPDPFGGLAILLGMGTLQLGLPYLLYILGIGRISGMEGILLASLEAVLNPVWTAMGAGETPSGHGIGGGLLILLSVGVYGFARSKGRRPAVPPPRSVTIEPPVADP